MIETSFADYHIAFDELGYLLKLQLPTSCGLRHQPRPYGPRSAYTFNIGFLGHNRMPREPAHENPRGGCPERLAERVLGSKEPHIVQRDLQRAG